MKRFISAILVSIIALISLSGCLGNGGDYVAEIGGTKISRGEFMVYLIEQKKNFEEQGGSDIWGADFDGVSAIEVAKQNALDSITMVKSAVKQTDSLGIKLDEKDISDVDNQTKNLMSEFSSEELNELSLDYDKIHSILEESALQGKVYNYVTSNYVVNSDEMSKYIEEYKKMPVNLIPTLYRSFLYREMLKAVHKTTLKLKKHITKLKTVLIFQL